MKFSMIFEAQIVDTSRKGEYEIMQECVEQAVLGEKVGFDRIWAVEHHCLKWYAHMSAPETFLAYVAGKTERIRIGHGVVCMPFNYNFPTRVAERAAMLDIILIAVPTPLTETREPDLIPVIKTKLGVAVAPAAAADR